MKSVMISIQPKWCEMIANGEKTVEVRKTKPKLETPFKCYIYCAKPKERYKVSGSMYEFEDELYRIPDGTIKYGTSVELMMYDDYDENNFLNGKVIGEFVCDRISEYCSDEPSIIWYELIKQSCLSVEQLEKYGDEKSIYGWGISKLKIYEKPKELGEFNKCHLCPYGPYERCYQLEYSCDGSYSLQKPPQSWCYAEKLEQG